MDGGRPLGLVGVRVGARVRARVRVRVRVGVRVRVRVTLTRPPRSQLRTATQPM